MSEELGDAGTDAAPEEGDQMASKAADTSPTPVATDSDFEDVNDELDGEGESGKVAENKTEKPAVKQTAEQNFSDSDAGDLPDPSMSFSSTGSSAGSSTPDSPTAFSSDGEGELQSYSVQPGDTLMRIAFEHYGDLYAWRKIYEANRNIISDPNNIPRGVTLKIAKGRGPGPVGRGDERYLIKWGDTLGSISDHIYGTPRKWRRLYEQNSSWIKDPNKIYAGFYLYYSLTPEERQEAERLKEQRTSAGSSVAAGPGGGEPGRNPASQK